MVNYFLKKIIGSFLIGIAAISAIPFVVVIMFLLVILAYIPYLSSCLDETIGV